MTSTCDAGLKVENESSVGRAAFDEAFAPFETPTGPAVAGAAGWFGSCPPAMSSPPDSSAPPPPRSTRSASRTPAAAPPVDGGSETGRPYGLRVRTRARSPEGEGLGSNVRPRKLARRGAGGGSERRRSKDDLRHRGRASRGSDEGSDQKQRGTPPNRQKAGGGLTKKRRMHLKGAQKAAAAARRGASAGGSTLRPGDALRRDDEAAAAAALVARVQARSEPPAGPRESRPRAPSFADEQFPTTRGPESAYAARRESEAAAASAPPSGSTIVSNASLVTFIEEHSQCPACDIPGARLGFCRYMPNAQAFVFSCAICVAETKLYAQPRVPVNSSSRADGLLTRRADELLAAPLAGMGYSVYKRFFSIMGLRPVDSNTFHDFASDVLLPAAKRAFRLTVEQALPLVEAAAVEHYQWDHTGLTPLC